MNFGQAIEALKAGKKVKRKHWLGYWEITNIPHLGEQTIVARKLGGDVNLNAPAQAYQGDMLAEDWEVL